MLLPCKKGKNIVTILKLYVGASTHTHHTTVLWPCWILSGTTRVSRHHKEGETSLDLLEQEIVAVAVVGPYANLHLDQDT